MNVERAATIDSAAFLLRANVEIHLNRRMKQRPAPVACSGAKARQ
jgi:hypothetical protein